MSATSHSADKFRTVVVGTGFIGPVHVEGLIRAGVNVVGIVGSTPEKSIAAARALGLPKGYASLHEVLSDDDVDVVHLATPNHLHYEQATAVLNAGKHVLCEKPLAMNSAQSRELVALAAATGLAAGVAHNIRFYPLCHDAAARIARGAIGDVLHVTGSYEQDWLLKDTDFNWRVLAADGGELRAVADIGTHWLDLMQFITGQKVSAVCANLQTVHPTRRRPASSGQAGMSQTFTGGGAESSEAVAITTEDAGFILLKFSGGAAGSLHVSQVTAGRKNCLRYEIAGSREALAWDSESPNQMWIGNRDEPNRTLLRDPALIADTAAAISTYPGGHNEGFPDTFKQLFRSFYGYLRGGDFHAACPFPTFADGHQEILLCEAIVQSHRSQSWMDVGPVGE